MVSNSQLRERARNILGNKLFGEYWLYAVLVCFISTAISSAASKFTSFDVYIYTKTISISVGAIIIFGPLAAGMANTFMKASRTGEGAKVENMFSGFKDFPSTFMLGLMSSLFIFLWTLLFIIPGIVKAYSYSMAFYIKNDHPEYNWKQCLNESKRMMKGNKGKLFCLHLSFIGWIIVGALCLGIGILWVWPYIYVSTVEFYNELLAKETDFKVDPENDAQNNTASGSTEQEEYSL